MAMAMAAISQIIQISLQRILILIEVGKINELKSKPHNCYVNILDSTLGEH